MKIRVIFMIAITIFLLSSGCTNTSLNITENRTNNVANTQVSPETNTNSIGMEFVLIPAGEFYMGLNDSSGGQSSHKVTIEKNYYLGKYEVTQAQWTQIMGSNPSEYEGDNLPVDSVSWNDAQEFVKKLNSKEGTNKYRLPSEAEWEYACRAGTTTKYSFGDDDSKLSEYAWYSGYATYKELNESSGKIVGSTHPVGQKKPNAWGLYDMHGNVYEWCQDRMHDSYNGAPIDGSVWEEGSDSSRIERGGSWFSYAEYCRSADRQNLVPDYFDSEIGFRLLREA